MLKGSAGFEAIGSWKVGLNGNSGVKWSGFGVEKRV